MEYAGIANLPGICKALTLCLSSSQQEERRFDSPSALMLRYPQLYGWYSPHRQHGQDTQQQA
jgi:hypothetical protein